MEAALLMLIGTGSPASDDPSFTTVVTAARAPRTLRQAPLETFVIAWREIERSPAIFADDLLRAAPMVQTFRRSSSFVADPTSQGLSLRGVAPSGVSRALVLLDGVPVTNGYGGWVYWRSLPRLQIARIEIVPGGGSAQYGSGALSGVVQLFSRPVMAGAWPHATRARASGDLDLEVGTQETLHGGARVRVETPRAAVVAEAETLRSSGFVVNAAPGPIDVPAASHHLTANARAEAALSRDLTLSASAAYFEERQSSGTRLAGAHVRNGGLVLGLDATARGLWRARLFARLERFRQWRTRVDAERTREVLTAEQSIPIDDEGALLSWTSPPLSAAGRHALTLGLDARQVGASTDAGAQRQQIIGVYAQDGWQPLPSLEFLAAVRTDVWHNRGPSGGDRVAAHFSPKLAVRCSPTEWLTLRGAIYDAFRAPTLNELYRPFQVGTVITAANDRLAPETLLGGELGAAFTLPRGITLRLTGIATSLSAPIVNATLNEPRDDGATRQRQNLGAARTLGLDAGVEWRAAGRLIVAVAYTLVDARVISGPAALIGKQLAQDPAHRLTASLAFDDPHIITLTLQLRVIGRQFEDDLNLLPMSPYAIVDASAARRMAGPVALYAAVQNLFDTTYLVGRAGIDTIGAPFMFHGGLRLRDQ